MSLLEKLMTLCIDRKQHKPRSSKRTLLAKASCEYGTNPHTLAAVPRCIDRTQHKPRSTKHTLLTKASCAYGTNPHTSAAV